MLKKVKKDNEDEEIVEMGQEGDGVYHPITVIKAQDQSMTRNDVMEDLPRWFPAIYEVMDGFVMGLGAIENFMMNMRRMDKKRRRITK